jgi:small-conductance mechanosensitive channel
MIIDIIKTILSYTFLKNSLADYGKSILIVIAGFILISIIKRVIIPRLQKAVDKTKLSIDSFVIANLRKQVLPVLYYIAFYLGIQNLAVHSKITFIINKAGLIIVIISVTRFIITLSLFLIRRYFTKNGDDLQKENIFSAIKTIISIITWAVALLIFLDNIGIKITGLITGLGIGGVAVAFAAQALLQDVFSYFSIFLDKPFELGDFIIVDNYMGSIEHIGIKTTRIRSLSGEQLIFSNADLTNSRVSNYKRMQERRVLFHIGVIYETPVSELKEIPELIRSIIEEKDNTRFDRSHFSSYGDFSLIFETVYYVNTNDYTIYMDVQHYINLRIKEEFEKRNIIFAYPTQLLYMDKKS